MNTRDQTILEAAYRVFARFGIGKTTMADIAAEAGVARQTVYNAYQNKEDLLRAVIRNSVLATERDLRDAWANSGDFEQKLETFFEIVPLAWYDAAQEAPQAAELIDGIHRIASAELDDAAVRYKSLLADLVAAEFDATSAHATEIADFVYSTAINAKFGAATRLDLETRLRLLKQSLLALLAPVP